MDAQKVDMFLMTQGKNFPEEFISTIRERLLQVSDDKAVMLSTMQFKDPTIVLILSIFLGSFGIDRFFIGDMGLGIGKLLTGGGCGVWLLQGIPFSDDRFRAFIVYMLAVPMQATAAAMSSQRQSAFGCSGCSIYSTHGTSQEKRETADMNKKKRLL